MITAVDTSVLVAIAKGEAEARRWTDLLAAARADGDLVICDVVAAEFFALLLDELDSAKFYPLSAAFARSDRRLMLRLKREVGEFGSQIDPAIDEVTQTGVVGQLSSDQG